MRKLRACRFLKPVVMGISSIGILPGIAEWTSRQASPQPANPGWGHLSMPASMVLSPDWLQGWEQFRFTKAEPAEPVAVPVKGASNDTELMASEPEIPFQLFGILSEDSDTYYCLYDVSRQRWIRLATGQVDPISQIQLSGRVNDERIEDLSTGKRYRIDRDRYCLVPIVPDERGVDEQ